jgi:hypothetical protein
MSIKKILDEMFPGGKFVVGTNETRAIDKEIENLTKQKESIDEKIITLQEKKKGILSKKTEEANK